MAREDRTNKQKVGATHAFGGDEHIPRHEGTNAVQHEGQVY